LNSATEESHSEHLLVILSAIGEKRLALWAWAELNRKWKIEELDHRSLRFLPAVYANIGLGDPQFSHKVRGKFRYNFVKNALRLKAIKPALVELDRENVGYRVLKGFAIALSNGQLGMRIMGDLDLVVQEVDLRKTLDILSKNGFSDKFSNGCRNFRLRKTLAKYTLIDSTGVEVDLHVAEYAFPSLLFKAMFRRAQVWVQWEDVRICLPSNKNLKQHAVIHGIQAVSDVDRLQSLVDVSTLAKLECRVESPKWWLLGLGFKIELSRLPKFYSRTTKTRIWSYFEQTYFALLYGLNRVVSYGLIRTSRSGKGRTYKSHQAWPRWRRILYFVWRLFESRSLIERSFISSIGGFLSKPRETVSSSKAYLLSEETAPFTVIQTPYDYRFRCRLERSIAKVDIHFRSESFLLRNYEVFCNGKILGTTNGTSSLGVTSFSTMRNLEVSIRNPLHSCEECFVSLNDLEVRFEYL